MVPSTARALLPTVSTVLVVAAGACAARALQAGVPGALVAAGILVPVAAVVALALAARRVPRRRDDLDAEWAAVEPRWRVAPDDGRPARRPPRGQGT